jgi:hypothetical protein
MRRIKKESRKKDILKNLTMNEIVKMEKKLRKRGKDRSAWRVEIICVRDHKSKPGDLTCPVYVFKKRTLWKLLKDILRKRIERV